MYTTELKLKDTQVAKEIDKFLMLTGKRHWENIIENIENNSGFFYKQYLYIQNPLASAISYYNMLCKKGKSIRHYINDRQIYFLCSNALLFNFLFKNLEDKCKNMLLGRIRADDIRSLLFEFETIIHFFRSGASIDFLEYEDKNNSGQIYDFFIQMNNKEFEVECKYKEYDSKRKITRPAMYMLLDLITKRINIQEFNCIVSIEVKNSLTKNHIRQNKIVERLKHKLYRNWEKSEYEEYYLEIIPIGFNGTLNTFEKVLNVIKPFYIANNHFVSLCGDNNNFFLRFLTLEKENLVDGIYESLKKTPSQFSQKRAAIISCYLEGIYSQDWIYLKDEGGLYNMTKHFLFKEENNFIHSVLYASKPEPSFKESLSDNKKPILTFKNPYTTFYKEFNTKDLINLYVLE